MHYRALHNESLSIYTQLVHYLKFSDACTRPAPNKRKREGTTIGKENPSALLQVLCRIYGKCTSVTRSQPVAFPFNNIVHRLLHIIKGKTTCTASHQKEAHSETVTTVTMHQKIPVAAHQFMQCAAMVLMANVQFTMC